MEKKTGTTPIADMPEGMFVQSQFNFLSFDAREKLLGQTLERKFGEIQTNTVIHGKDGYSRMEAEIPIIIYFDKSMISSCNLGARKELTFKYKSLEELSEDLKGTCEGFRSEILVDGQGSMSGYLSTKTAIPDVRKILVKDYVVRLDYGIFSHPEGSQ